MKKLATAMVLVGCICLLSACQADPERDRMYSGEPMTVSTAPDGTTLWRVYDKLDGKMVYFSSKGTFHTTTERQGKVSRTEEHHVPNSQ